MARPSSSALDRAFGRALSARPAPRPFVPPAPPVVTLRFALPHATTARIRVVDLRDFEVRVLACGELEPGEHRCSWDGRDDSGRPVAPGDYTLRLETPGGMLTSRIVTIR